MSNLSGPEIVKKYGQASAVKATWDAIYRQVFEYCMPSRDGFSKPTTNNRQSEDYTDPDRENQYSSLGEQCADEFVNTMQELLCPPQGNWISLEAGTKFEVQKRKTVNKELAKVCEIANEHKNNSTFDVAFSEFCYDLFAGTACMLLLPDTALNPISYQAIALKEYCIVEGRNGEVRGVFRSFSMKKELAKYQWPELKSMKLGKTDQEKDMNFIECTWYDYDTQIFFYSVVDKEKQTILVERKYKTNPFIVLRWNKAAGEAYGRGPGIKILNDLKTLNLVKEYSLRNFAFNIPPLLVEADAAIDTDAFNLTPFALNVVPNVDGVKPLTLSANYDIESYKISDLTQDIKRGAYCSSLPNEKIGEMTATEANMRKADLRRGMNSVYGRIISEFQIPLVRRMFNILIDTKYVRAQFDVGKIDGLMFKVKVNTPLAKQLGLNDAQSIIGAVSLISNLDPSGVLLKSMLDTNPMAAYLLGLLGVPDKFIKEPEDATAEQEAIMDSTARSQQAAVQQDVDAQVAIAEGKEQAKALNK